jgi:hypothetical protein
MIEGKSICINCRRKHESALNFQKGSLEGLKGQMFR